jgi:uncharacterized membrane protein
MKNMEKIGKKIVVLKDKGAEFEREVREKTLGYIITSFGLVAGLAWNDAIKTFIEAFFPLQKDSMKAKFIYAVVITAVVVFISLYVSRFFKKEIKKEDKEAVVEAEKKETKKKTSKKK